MKRMMFVNVAVRDLERTKQFFVRLGFKFNPKFTDEKGACMLVGSDAFVMLLARPFFQTFTQREPCDTTKHTEAMLAISAASRDEVDSLVAKAVEGGATLAMPTQDHGFMYGKSFYDLDGHHWEVMWMDPKVANG